MALAFGFVFPLLALAEMPPSFVSPRFVAIGLLSALFPLLGYFLTELLHYRILSLGLMSDASEWGREWPVVIVALGGAVLGLGYAIV
jgi:hypothetical protein